MKRVAILLTLGAVTGCVPFPVTEWRYQAKNDHCAAKSPYYLVGGCDDYEVRLEPGLEISPGVLTDADGLTISFNVHAKLDSWQLKGNAVSLLVNGKVVTLAATRITIGNGFAEYSFRYPDRTIKDAVIRSTVVAAEGREILVPDIHVWYGTHLAVSGQLQ